MFSPLLNVLNSKHVQHFTIQTLFFKNVLPNNLRNEILFLRKFHKTKAYVLFLPLYAKIDANPCLNKELRISSKRCCSRLAELAP